MSELFTGGGLEAAASAASAPVAADTSVSTPTPAAADALSAAGTATTPPAATDGAAGTTTTTDPAAQPQQATPTPKGPIPFEAHKTALDNARLKATQEAEAKFAWTQTIPEQHRPTVSQFYQLLDTEPTQAVEVLIQQIAADPQHAPKLRSLFGKLLGGRNAQPQPGQGAVNNGTTALPDADAEGVDESGRRIPLYSADAMAKLAAAIEQRIDAKYSGKLGPLEQDYRSRQQREQQAEQKRTSDAWAAKEYARLAQYPHFTEHEQEIAAAMQADDTLGVQDAYIQIVIPKLQQQERKAVVTGLHDKANASGINPANPSSAAQAPPRSFEEALARVPAASWG